MSLNAFFFFFFTDFASFRCISLNSRGKFKRVARFKDHCGWRKTFNYNGVSFFSSFENINPWIKPNARNWAWFKFKRRLSRKFRGLGGVPKCGVPS